MNYESRYLGCISSTNKGDNAKLMPEAPWVSPTCGLSVELSLD